MISLEYITQKSINYENNKEYRQSLRYLFCMNNESYLEKVNAIRNVENLDDETEDEISYDEESTSKILDEIYLQTKHDPLMINLYTIAASKMFSEDINIGIAVLFSYDYLKLFHLCLVDYLKNPIEFTRENFNYVNLLKKIS